MLVDVKTDDGVFLAKVIDEDDETYEVRLLTYRKSGIFRYGPPLVVEKEHITGFYNPEDTEIAAGFKKTNEGYILLDEESSDDDYTPSSDGEESTSESDEEVCE
jgi:hypothetical protein